MNAGAGLPHLQTMEDGFEVPAAKMMMVDGESRKPYAGTDDQVLLFML